MENKVFADDKDRGLTSGPEKLLGPAPEDLEVVAFRRYWSIVPHYAISKTEAWPMWLEFLAFWEAYPRKTAKPPAWKAWLKSQPVLADVLKAISWQVECEQWVKEDGTFIPMPATYLNQLRWEDECPADLRDEVAPVVPIDAKRYTADGELIEEGE